MTTTISAAVGSAAGPGPRTSASAGPLDRVTPLAVTGCGVLSTAGPGLDALAETLRGAEPDDRLPVGDAPGDFPPWPLRAVPDLAPLIDRHVGRKGVRNLDRMTMFGLIAYGLALEQAGAAADDQEHRGSGVVLGTSTGSVRSIAELARDSLISERPYLVNASRFPNTVMNSAAGQIAIRYNLPGVNATIAAGRLSGLSAVRYARVALGNGKATRLLVGGIEELSPLVAWAWVRAGGLAAGTALGEGCAVFALERPASAVACGRDMIAELLACEVFHCGGPRGDGASRTLLASVTAGLARCVVQALARSDVQPEEVDVVALGAGSHPGLAQAETRALRSALGRVPGTIDITRTLGECYSASTALQLAALLAERPGGGCPPRGRIALVTSIGRDGNVGCLVARV